MSGDSTILVTGGAGFIGSHLIESLLPTGATVLSLDNYFIGLKENHIAGAEYREGHTKDISERIPETPDIVFHLGEYSRVEQSMLEPDIVWDLNARGTFSVLEFCRKKNCKLVYAGSSTKFGDGGLGRDQSPYAWTKASNTELVANYGEWYGLKFAITYFYNVYGGREISDGKYATVVGAFKKCLQEGQPLRVTSPGTQRRNFTHVNDIVRGLILVGERGEGDEFGLGADEHYSILEVAELFGLPIEMMPEKKGTRMNARLDTKRARAELGWSTKCKLEDYITMVKDSIKNT